LKLADDGRGLVIAVYVFGPPLIAMLIFAGVVIWEHRNE
jgi:hypothetical protein